MLSEGLISRDDGSSCFQYPGFVLGMTPIGAVPYDIALMKTSAPIKKAGFYKVDLAPPGETFVGVNCTVTGWGYVDYTDGNLFIYRCTGLEIVNFIC